ncbi:HAD family hydrolase [Thioalkalivibrio sp.]|uniref:HAD family hydrolase n=1 Tax=Thioalkalivibrio sp. TaxID=2093813 RepID=UPI0012D5D9F7|nr:HAD family hydrolase [Thioalkalivibrio sp.]TVP78515.1 MAG: HAD family hydrolase [Thioalkalivibrio sp.]
MSNVRAVILDLDGTLLCSNDAHAQAFLEAGREMGVNVDFDAIRRLIGKGGDKLIPEAFGFSSESEPGQRLSTRKKEIFMARYLDQLAPTPGARDLLLRLRDEGIRRVLATSSGESSVNRLLKQAGVEDLIEEAASSSDVQASKPDPDIVKVAMEKLGVPAEQVVMLGDTPYDVEAAARAGIRLIALRSGGWSDRELRGAAAIYDDPADLLEHYEASLLG